MGDNLLLFDDGALARRMKGGGGGVGSFDDSGFAFKTFKLCSKALRSCHGKSSC
jgi:hypothetical protein